MLSSCTKVALLGCCFVVDLFVLCFNSFVLIVDKSVQQALELQSSTSVSAIPAVNQP